MFLPRTLEAATATILKNIYLWKTSATDASSVGQTTTIVNGWFWLGRAKITRG